MNNEYRGMESWIYERCSICFDHILDFSLANCRDQFCRPCFTKYISILVDSSWGLQPKRITCPVCSDLLERADWVRFVDDPRTIQKYDMANRPFRVREVPCHSCAKDVCVATPPLFGRVDRESKANEILSTYRTILSDGDENMMNADPPLPLSTTALTLYTRFEADLNNILAGGSVSLIDVYRNICDDLPISRSVKRNPTASPAASQQYHVAPPTFMLATRMMKDLITLETRPDSWRYLNVLQLQKFPFALCTSCDNATCTACGDASHYSLTCHDAIHRRLATETNTENRETLQWKLNFTKTCPRCGICITRDEGCFRVDCAHCGFKWCWSCGHEFDDKHGYYTCQKSPSTGGTVAIQKGDDSKPELGVPNVTLIHSKMSTIAAKFGM
ncbi:hypothetical protein SeLEV6574_g01181 [Synchytrium endobioticum]|nr:hypothetical protein SeLEV6574_g01181 [Synchytrium endobioticum]